MWRRTRIKAVANLPVRRAKDVTNDNAVSTLAGTSDQNKSSNKSTSESKSYFDVGDDNKDSEVCEGNNYSDVGEDNNDSEVRGCNTDSEVCEVNNDSEVCEGNNDSEVYEVINDSEVYEVINDSEVYETNNDSEVYEIVDSEVYEIKRDIEVCEGNSDFVVCDVNNDPEVCDGSNDSEICDVPMTVLGSNISISSTAESSVDEEHLSHRDLSLVTESNKVVGNSNSFQERPLVEVESFENDYELSSQLTTHRGVEVVPQQIAVTCSLGLSTERDDVIILSSDDSNSVTFVEKQSESQTVLSKKANSTKTSLTVGGVGKQTIGYLTDACVSSKSRYADSVSEFSSYEDISRNSSSSSSKEPENRQKMLKPVLPQVSSARGDKSLEHEKSPNKVQDEVGESSKFEQVKNDRKRKVRSPISDRITKAKRAFRSKYKGKPPDRGSLTMFDLIYYNPVTNPMRKNVQQETSMNLENNESVIQHLQEEEVDADVENDTEETPLPVPQVRLGADGQLIIDEKSLVIETTDVIKSKQILAKSSVVVDSGDDPSSYLAYNKQIRSRKCSSWTRMETLRFYVGLKTFGTDFLLMQSIFPQFTRKELKYKYKKEERVNRRLVQAALRQQKFDPEQMEKDLRKLQEREKALEEIQEKAAKEKNYVQSMRKTTRKQKAKGTIQERKRNMELIQVENGASNEKVMQSDVEKEKRILRPKKKGAKKLRAKESVTRGELGKCFQERPNSGLEGDSLDEAEVEKQPSRSISKNVPRTGSLENTTDVDYGDNFQTSYSYDTNNSEYSKEIADTEKGESKSTKLKRNTSHKKPSKSVIKKSCKKQTKFSKVGKPLKKKLKDNYEICSKEGKKQKGQSSNEDEFTDTDEIYSSEGSTGRLYIALSDTSETSRDKSDIDEEVCSVMDTLKENIEKSNVHSETLHSEMQYSENEPLMMENELRRLVGSADNTPPMGNSAVPLGDDVGTPTPGSLFILSSVSPTDPNHLIYKVFMVTPPGQLPSTSQSPH